MKSSLPIVCSFLFLMSCAQTELEPTNETPTANTDVFARSGRMILETYSDKQEFLYGEPIVLKGIAINHSDSRKSPFVMLPVGDLHNLIFRVRNLHNQDLFSFSDLHLEQAKAILSADATNLQVSPGDTVNAFRIDFQRMDGFTKSFLDENDNPVKEEFNLIPGDIYQLTWTVNGAAHTTSRPYFFTVKDE